MFKKTTRILFELSNLCNMNHEKCPAAHIDHPIILPEKIVYHVLEVCQEYNYKGEICFHRYNEPGIDPRLMLFIDKAKKSCTRIFFMTNGFYLNKTLEAEFYAHGVSEISVSNYTDPNYPFDDRLHFMDRPDTDCNKPCGAPLNEIIITCEGTVGLCCYDWRNDHTFGDLHSMSLPEILLSEKVMKVHERLSIGDRYLNLCKKCIATR